ncbi:MAG: hypothetical protein EOO33_18865, partial [Comamonadaceae bacterium]
VTEHHRLPRSAAKGTQTAGSPFLCLLSFGEAKESECAAGRISRPREAKPQHNPIKTRDTNHQRSNERKTSPPPQRQAQPQPNRN